MRKDIELFCSSFLPSKKETQTKQKKKPFLCFFFISKIWVIPSQWRLHPHIPSQSQIISNKPPVTNLTRIFPWNNPIIDKKLHLTFRQTKIPIKIKKSLSNVNSSLNFFNLLDGMFPSFRLVIILSLLYITVF